MYHKSFNQSCLTSVFGTFFCQEPVVDLLILVGPEPVVKYLNRESIPEDVPGEMNMNSCWVADKAAGSFGQIICKS